MRKLSLVSAVMVALVLAGIAVANGFDGTKSAASVAGTFAATAAANVETKTCTTSDGKTIAVTKATYSGTAAGAADLAGPATLKVHSFINTTDGVGVVSGTLKIDTAADKNTVAQFDTVYDHGKLAGLASGHAQDRHVKLLANLSAGFSAAGGFTDGKLGGGTAGGTAVALGPGKCEATPKETSSAHGAVSAVSATSITVAGLTCAVPASLAAQLADVKVGDRLEIRCSLAGGANTLVAVGGKKK
jgi:hypothetical protein